MKHSYLIDALQKKLEGEIAIARANVNVYLENPAGIGEHPEILAAIESQIEIIAEAQDKLEVIKGQHFNPTNHWSGIE